MLFVPLSSVLALLDGHSPRVQPCTSGPSGAPPASTDARPLPAAAQRFFDDGMGERVYSWNLWAPEYIRLLRLRRGYSSISAFGSKCAVAFTSRADDGRRMVDLFVFDAHRWAHAPPVRMSDDRSQHASQFFEGLEGSAVGISDLFCGSRAEMRKSSPLPIRVRHRQFACHDRNGAPPDAGLSGRRRLNVLEDGLIYAYYATDDWNSTVGTPNHYSFFV
ncbi:hypothetical protein OH77DRAFT_1254655 [Trametes cingulata]|nr:hypothetical protein OH77DRAFT_1254655 [Trametes cingulata]